MKILKSAVLAILLCTLSLSAQATLINGSFEIASIDPADSSTGAFALSGSEINYWTATGNSTVDYMVDGAFGPLYSPTFGSGLASQDGNYFVDLTGGDQNDFGSIEQTINTTLGQDYLLSFWIAGSNLFEDFGDGGPLNVDLSGVFNQSFTGSRNSATDWQLQTVMFTGTGGAATLRFTGRQMDDCCFIGLDNVSIKALPEPGTLWMLLLGFSVIAWTRWSIPR
jgi:hypothetical protein